VEPYKQSQPAIGLSLEVMTPDVPPDGFFYVLLNGEIKGRFKGLRQAQQFYRELLKASGWEPPRTDRPYVDPAAEAVERYMDELQEYWGTSHQHRRPGVRRA
jgi:hypothetical protein